MTSTSWTITICSLVNRIPLSLSSFLQSPPDQFSPTMPSHDLPSNAHATGCTTPVAQKARPVWLAWQGFCGRKTQLNWAVPGWTCQTGPDRSDKVAWTVRQTEASTGQFTRDSESDPAHCTQNGVQTGLFSVILNFEISLLGTITTNITVNETSDSLKWERLPKMQWLQH